MIERKQKAGEINFDFINNTEVYFLFPNARESAFQLQTAFDDAIHRRTSFRRTKGSQEGPRAVAASLTAALAAT
jgi:hypothetical protein